MMRNMSQTTQKLIKLELYLIERKGHLKMDLCNNPYKKENKYKIEEIELLQSTIADIKSD